MTRAAIFRRRNMVSCLTRCDGTVMAIRTSEACRERDCSERPEAGMIDCREGEAAAGGVTHTAFIAGADRIGMNDRQGLGAGGRAGNG